MDKLLKLIKEGKADNATSAIANILKKKMLEIIGEEKKRVAADVFEDIDEGFKVRAAFGGKVLSKHRTSDAAHKQAKKHSLKQPVHIWTDKGGHFGEGRPVAHYNDGVHTSMVKEEIELTEAANDFTEFHKKALEHGYKQTSSHPQGTGHLSHYKHPHGHEMMVGHTKKNKLTSLSHVGNVGTDKESAKGTPDANIHHLAKYHSDAEKSHVKESVEWLTEETTSQISTLASKHGFKHHGFHKKSDKHVVHVLRHPSGHELKVNHYKGHPTGNWSLSHNGKSKAMGHDNIHLAHELGKVNVKEDHAKDSPHRTTFANMPNWSSTASSEKPKPKKKRSNWKADAYKSLGLKKVKGALGGTYWE